MTASTHITFTIPAVELRAVALAAGQKDVRPYLNGVAFDFAKDGLYLVGTDGHRIHVIKALVSDPSSIQALTGHTVIVPNDAIKQIKTRDASALLTVDIKQTVDGSRVLHDITLSIGGVSATAAEIHEHYPDWRRVLPKHHAGRTIDRANPGATAYPAYLADAVAALGLLSGSRDPSFQYQFVEPTFTPSTGKGDVTASGVYVLGLPPAGERFVAFAMPYICLVDKKAVVLDLPEWLSPKATKTAVDVDADLGDLV